MHAHAMRRGPSAFLRKAGNWLHIGACRLDAWLAARAKWREDALALQAMSDRDLRDIGLDPRLVDSAEWPKDWRL